MFHGLNAFYVEKINKRNRISESLKRNEGKTPTETDSRATRCLKGAFSDLLLIFSPFYLFPRDNSITFLFLCSKISQK